MFSAWYHGTYRQNVASIREHGLQARYYGDNYQGFGQPYLTLFRNKYNAALPDREVVFTFHVPNDEAGEYIALSMSSLEAGLRRPLPPRMIHAVEDL